MTRCKHKGQGHEANRVLSGKDLRKSRLPAPYHRYRDSTSVRLRRDLPPEIIETTPDAVNGSVGFIPGIQFGIRHTKEFARKVSKGGHSSYWIPYLLPSLLNIANRTI